MQAVYDSWRSVVERRDLLIRARADGKELVAHAITTTAGRRMPSSRSTARLPRAWSRGALRHGSAFTARSGAQGRFELADAAASSSMRSATSRPCSEAPARDSGARVRARGAGDDQVDVRILRRRTAIGALRRGGAFRQDLYYRLNGSRSIFAAQDGKRHSALATLRREVRQKNGKNVSGFRPRPSTCSWRTTGRGTSGSRELPRARGAREQRLRSSTGTLPRPSRRDASERASGARSMRRSAHRRELISEALKVSRGTCARLPRRSASRTRDGAAHEALRHRLRRFACTAEPARRRRCARAKYLLRNV